LLACWLDLEILADTIWIIVAGGGRSMTDLDEDSEEAMATRVDPASLAWRVRLTGYEALQA
jgi:hypothetical protein